MSTSLAPKNDADSPTIDLAEAKRLDAVVVEERPGAIRYLEAVVKLRETKGWRLLGFSSWADYAADKGPNSTALSRSFVFRQLQAALVVKELEADETHKPPLVAPGRQANTDASPAPREMPVKHLVALAAAPEGTRAEVLKVATKAADGKPTEAVVKAAVEAKKANPTATPAELVKAVVEAKPKPPKPIVPEAVEEIREERAERAAIRAEITDDEWLASLPLASELEGHALDKFRRDAIDYRDFESTVTKDVPLRKAVKEFFARAKRRQKGKVWHQGVTAYRADGLLSVEHPSVWHKCPATEKGGCGGTGSVGSYGQCSMCHGRGYLPR